jgi:hypothetical protein
VTIQLFFFYLKWLDYASSVKANDTLPIIFPLTTLGDREINPTISWSKKLIIMKQQHVDLNKAFHKPSSISNWFRNQKLI